MKRSNKMLARALREANLTTDRAGVTVLDEMPVTSGHSARGAIVGMLVGAGLWLLILTLTNVVKL